MRAVDIIIKKRDAGELTRAEIEFFIHGYVSGDIPDYQAAALAMAIVQPLLENAVKHGISQVLEGGTIRIATSVGGDRLKITVENPCDASAPVARSKGFGLENTRARLSTLYGKEARIETGRSGERFHVEVSLPAKRVAS